MICFLSAVLTMAFLGGLSLAFGMVSILAMATVSAEARMLM